MKFLNIYKRLYKRMIGDLNNNNYMNDVDDISDLSKRFNIPIKYTLPKWEFNNGEWILNTKSQQKVLKKYLND